MQANLNQILSLPPFQSYIEKAETIAVAVSGGADSMALSHLLNSWAQENKITLHAITVDHALRPESSAEAAQVAQWLSAYPAITHTILTWRGEKPETAIQNSARKARYDLMADYCKVHGIQCLFTAHHQDDQAETFLMRLSKGSGLKGLSAMQPVHRYSETLTIARPLLAVPKQDLIGLCTENNIPFVNDPSNTNRKFTRARLRQSTQILAEEGLTAKRLATTAARLAKAEDALNHFTDQAWNDVLLESNPNQIVLKSEGAIQAPYEITLRLIIKAHGILMPEQGYLPRMEKLEALCQSLRAEDVFSARTLGGIKFVRKDLANKIIMSVEDRLVS